MKCVLTDKRMDGGYGFIIVCASFCLIFISDGIMFSFGLLMVELINEFKNERATSALTGSILLGPFCGVLCNKYGCRTVTVFGSLLSCAAFVASFFATSIYFLYITYGCLGGIGQGFIYMSANIINVQYFSKHRGKACGVALCGSGVGTFAFNQVYRILIEKYGWRGTILLQAGLCLQCIVFGLLLLPPLQFDQHTDVETEETETSVDMNGTIVKMVYTVEDNNAITNGTETLSNDIVITVANSKKKRSITSKPSKEIQTIFIKDKVKRILCNSCLRDTCKEIFDRQLLSDKRLWIFITSTIIVYLAFAVVMNMTIDYAIESGMSNFEASWLASSIVITNSVGSVVFGVLADVRIVSRIFSVSGLLILAGISTLISVVLTTFTTRLILMSLYGFFIGGYVAICPLLLADIFSPEMIAKSFGLYLFSVGISALVSTPIGGLLFDKTGSYDVTFTVAGSELFVAGLVVLLLKFMKNKNK